MHVFTISRMLKAAMLIFLCVPVIPVFSQPTFRLTGTVKHTTGMENVTVLLLPAEEYVVTDNQGNFSFLQLPAGQYELRVSAVGYATETIPLSLRGDTSITIRLRERIVGLKEVTVVAQPKKIGSSSVIDKSAIIHTQPVSLADMLQLVPGQLAVNPSLGVAQQVNLRQVPSTTDASRANALGTQIIMDGVPVSNNANLQSDVNILNASPSALPPFSSVAGRGNDLRQIPGDNIENIEVVRGIPSAKFGDLTSGLIIVNSRIGAFRPEVRVRLNPNLVQAAVLGGFRNKKGNNVYNMSTDLLNARDDVRDPFNRYTRLQAQVGWQRNWDEKKKFITTTIVSGYKTLDNLKQDPDDRRYQSRYYSDDYTLKWSTDGRWKADKKWITALQYTAALTHGRQKGYYQSLVTRDLYPLSTAMSDTTMPGVYGRSEYLNQTTVEGKPVNGYARVEASLFKNILRIRHRFLAGSEWRMDVNTGAGRLFDPVYPPRQNYSMGDRPRRYDEVPALHQLAYYLEDRFSGSIGNRSFIVQAGARLDNLAPVGPFKSRYKTIVSPRINLATELGKGFWFRGGYGIAAKMPTLNFLYPGTRFFDLVNFNYFAANPAERLVIITTRTINLDDQHLAPYQSRKWEAGLDIEKKRFFANVSFFHETTTGAIGMNREVKPFTYARLRAQNTPAGQPPLLDPVPISIDTFFAAYDIPVNNRHITNSGVEYAINIPEISSIRTSFNITGAWIRTESYDDGHFMDAATAYQSNTTPARIAIYQSSTKVTASRMNTSVRFIHRLSTLNIVFSALWQTVWWTENRPGVLSPYPVAYLNRQGAVIPLGESDAKSPAYEDLVRPVGTLQTTRYPALHLFNIRCTKEWKKGFGFSFYANNFLSYRPLHADNNTGGRVRRNEPLFFGAEFNISIQ